MVCRAGNTDHCCMRLQQHRSPEPTVSGCHVALWSYQRPDIVAIADPGGNVVDSYPVPQSNGRPSWKMLAQTAWCLYPGSEWEEEPPGQWSAAVFSQGVTRKGVGGDG
jgi:hypothetical protein